MSTQGIESVLSRAMSDSSFADALFANPAQALASFDLTAEEVAKFQDMSRADFESLVTEDRRSFAIIISEIVVKHDISNAPISAPK